MRSTLRRPGAVVIIMLVALTLAMAIFFVVVKRCLLAKEVLDLELRRAQATALVEAGLDRAAAQIAADPSYRGETWKLSPEEMAGKDAAAVTIRVEAGSSRKVTVLADFPDHPIDRVRATRER